MLAQTLRDELFYSRAWLSVSSVLSRVDDFIAAVSIRLRQTQCVIYRPDISSHIHGCLCFALTVHSLLLLFVVNSWIWMRGEIIAFHRCGNRWIVKRRLIKQSPFHSHLPSLSLLFSQPRRTSYETMNTHSQRVKTISGIPSWCGSKNTKTEGRAHFYWFHPSLSCRRRWGCLHNPLP